VKIRMAPAQREVRQVDGRVHGHPWIPGLVTAISIGLLFGFVVANPRPSLYAVVILAANYPVYAWLRRHSDPSQ
jgi:hypothetical protein